MKNLRILLFAFLFVINTSCNNRVKKEAQASQLDYDQAIVLLKRYMLDLKLYKHEEDINFIYEPNQSAWNRRYSKSLKIPKEWGLTDSNYYVFILLNKITGAGKSDIFVFIDKNEKRIIGLYNGESFLENTKDYISSEKWQAQHSQSNYDQFVVLLKQHVLSIGLYEQKEDIRFFYDPKNMFWNMRYSKSSKIIERCGLTNRNYYAFFLLGKTEGVIDSGAFVFIDKDEKRIIGILFDNGRFVENTAK